MEIIVTRERMRAMLWNWGQTVKTIAAHEKELKDMRRMIIEAHNPLHAKNMDGMPHGSGISDSTLAAVEQIEKLERNYLAAERAATEIIENRLKLKLVLDENILRLSNVQQQVILYRYHDRMEWHSIARRMNYCDMQVKRHDAQAIDMLRECDEIKKCSAKLIF